MAQEIEALKQRISQLEKELSEVKASESLKNNLIENCPDILYQTNLEGVTVFMNAASEALCGFKPEEITGKVLSQEFYRQPEIREQLLAELQEKGYINNFVNQLKAKDGSFWWGSANARICFDESGIPTGIEGSVRDVTKEVEASQALIESEERYRLLYEAAGVEIVYWSPDGVLLEVNNKASIIVNKTPEELKGKHILDILEEQTGRLMLERIQKAAGSDGSHTYELEFLEKTYLSTYSRVMGFEGQVQGIQVVAFDITKRKQEEKEKEKLIHQLQTTLNEVKELQGMIPICASCKSIRDDAGYWGQIEQYLEKNTDAVFSHTVCPDCSEKLYGHLPWYQKVKEKKKDATEK